MHGNARAIYNHGLGCGCDWRQLVLTLWEPHTRLTQARSTTHLSGQLAPRETMCISRNQNSGQSVTVKVV